MRTTTLFHALFILVMACPALGQVSKKILTENDYTLWSTMEVEQLSDDGAWVSYTLHYQSGADTLFVKHTKTLKTFAFDGGTDGHLVADQCFVFRGKSGGVVLANLRTGKQHQFSNIGSYAVALGGKMILLLEKKTNTAGNLLIVGTDGNRLLTLPKVTLFSLNPALDRLVYDSEQKLQLMELNDLDSNAIIDLKKQNYQSITWQHNGASLVYIADDALGTVGYYQLNEKKGYAFDRSKFGDFPKDGEIYNASVTELAISDDGNRVFFGVKQKQATIPVTDVQVWNTADKVLYPRKALVNGWIGRPKLAVWWPEEQKFRMVTDNQFPYQELLPRQELALVHNPMDNEPQFDYDAPIDYYLQNITTGQQKLFLPKFSADQNKIGISNTGNYIAYFKDKYWWVYDIKADMHRNLTLQTGHSFTDEKYDRTGEEKVCGIAGWTVNDNELLVYDSYDIWQLKTDGSVAVCLTKGHEVGIVYRVASKSRYGATGSVANGILNLNDGLLLQAVSDTKSGYFTWNVKKGLQQIVFENNRIGTIKRSTNGVYVYTREHYHLSPQLLVQFNKNKPKVLYESNPQQQKYQWGFSKLITYENSKGQVLNGALFYPAGYDADKSYPMVVYIYERLSDFYNQYVNPSLLNQDGFNISNLTTQGYFVLLPDIAYEKGKPGQSAVDCVVSAVNEVLKHESVDKKSIGLVGHSFGGYETSFIVTQTHLFAAAISGAGFNDFVSSYLTMGLSNMKQDCWRYEDSQLRMGQPLFDQFNQYLQNSPVTFAPQVRTPFLLWAGTSDNSIDYRQSLELHLALRRLQKPNILLLYEKGGHALMKREHQIDLAHRMQQWWDYYLKGATIPDWFAPDTL